MAHAPTDMITQTGRVVPALKITKRTLLNRSIALYGPSGVGKTHITKHMLDLLRGEVDQIIVVSPTELANHSYERYVPSQLIHYTMTAPDPKNPRKRLTGAKGAEAFLQQIFDRQEMLRGIFDRANALSVLRELFARVSPELQAAAQPVINKITEVHKRSGARLKSKRLPPGVLIERQKELDYCIDRKYMVVYKHYIRQDFSRLWARRARLSAGEQWALTYFELKPGLVLVFDDCASDLKPLFKTPLFRRLFYQNRHYYTTVIFSFQDDTDLVPNLRKNAFVSIYCSEVICRSFFSQTTNRFSKEEKQMVDDIATTAFELRNRKVAYIREDPLGHHFYHFTAPATDERPFCSPAVLELCQGVQSTENLNAENPFYNSFQPL